MSEDCNMLSRARAARRRIRIRLKHPLPAGKEIRTVLPDTARGPEKPSERKDGK